MKKSLINILLTTLLCSTTFSASAAKLEKITNVKNLKSGASTTVSSNQIAFSTENIPWGSYVTVQCSMNNQADFEGYLYVTPYSGSFSRITHKTCTVGGCFKVSGPKIYLGLANTTVKIHGVSSYNQAIIFTNYSNQFMDVECWY